MPHRFTFKLKPIAQLLTEEVRGGIWLDPMCGELSPATIKNDLNPERPADYHLDAVEFLKMFPDNYADGVIYDPPYSPRQVSECYKGFGKEVTGKDTSANFHKRVKTEIARVIKGDGKAICFGWNSVGIGKNLGFQITRIMLVCHGSALNDTICTVERKIQSTFDFNE